MDRHFLGIGGGLGSVRAAPRHGAGSGRDPAAERQFRGIGQPPGHAPADSPAALRIAAGWDAIFRQVRAESAAPALRDTFTRAAPRRGSDNHGWDKAFADAGAPPAMIGRPA